MNLFSLRVLTCLMCLTAVLFVAPAAIQAEHDGKVQILLLGDSTTIGSVCRQTNPAGPHLEDVVRLLLATDKELPPTNVITLQTFTKTDGTNGYLRVTDSQAKIASPKRFAWVEYTHDRTIPAAP